MTDGDGEYIPYEEISMGKSIYNPKKLWLYPYYYEYDKDYNETRYAITEISEGAFIEFDTMEYVVIPRTVRTIGDYAVGYTSKSPDAKIENFVIYGYKNSAAQEYAQENGFEFRPLGMGIQNFKTILRAAEEAGCEYVIVEQDQTYDTPELEAARISREYLRREFGL